ncbi:hypothetical protein RR46_00977 [Papilio xuthus]|uniref:Uncharacterized protein n=1 Tax=Papilio xuthus TaxID=66420 RepID=A0A0N1I576_PAPXU|nr:hypothetical protein RR46_00977 [Papilio xuthus]
MAKGRSKGDCNTIGRLMRELCSCAEHGAWSPDMTPDMSDKRRGPFLSTELTNMAALRRRVVAMARRKHKRPQPPILKCDKDVMATDALVSNVHFLTTTSSSDGSTMKRNIDNFLMSRRMLAFEEDVYEKPIQHADRSSSCGENWSLSKAWKNSNIDYFSRPPTLVPLTRRGEVARSGGRNRRLKEQMRYDGNIKRHIRIRVMLSLRMHRYVKSRLRKPAAAGQCASVPARTFPRAATDTASFGSRSWDSAGRARGDVLEARNATLALCHDYAQDVDSLHVALRAGNFRSGVRAGCAGRGVGSGGMPGGALALHYAAARGCLDCVRLLATTTPDVNARSGAAVAVGVCSVNVLVVAAHQLLLSTFFAARRLNNKIERKRKPKAFGAGIHSRGESVTELIATSDGKPCSRLNTSHSHRWRSFGYIL